jgi:hypothetical protein
VGRLGSTVAGRRFYDGEDAPQAGVAGEGGAQLRAGGGYGLGQVEG